MSSILRSKLHFRYLLTALLFSLILTAFNQAFAQDTVRCMQYNILKFGITTTACNSSNNNIGDKIANLDIILSRVKPDLFVVNELGPNPVYAENILVNVLRDISPNYERADLTNVASADESNMLYYNSKKFTLENQWVVNHFLRDINIYRLYFNDANLETTGDTAWLYVVGIHLKAASGTGWQATQLQQAELTMDWLDALGEPANILLMGDLNVSTSTNDAYQEFTAHPNNDIRLYDPVNTPGSWSNETYAALHTQSTHTSGGCASGGGLDDRFDFILASDYIMSGSDKYTYIPGTYQAYGNDGDHYNKAILDPPTIPGGTLLAGALYNASDHLPVIMDIEVDGVLASRPEPLSGIRGMEIGLMGNPVGKDLSLSIQNQHATPVSLTLELLDLTGRVIQKDQLRVLPGSNQHLWTLENVPAGLWILKSTAANGENVSKKLIKR